MALPDSPQNDAADDCTDCPLSGRRSFLRDAAALVGAAVLGLGGAPSAASAMSVRLVRALGVNGDERSYPIPAADGATIDRDAEVIIMRFQQHRYAFSLSCPHQHTALRWMAAEGRFQCPKHHSRYQPDGLFISGRATRNMDRFALRKDDGKLVVDLEKLYRADKNPAEWSAASVAA